MLAALPFTEAPLSRHRRPRRGVLAPGCEAAVQRCDSTPPSSAATAGSGTVLVYTALLCLHTARQCAIPAGVDSDARRHRWGDARTVATEIGPVTGGSVGGRAELLRVAMWGAACGGGGRRVEDGRWESSTGRQRALPTSLYPPMCRRAIAEPALAVRSTVAHLYLRGLPATAALRTAHTPLHALRTSTRSPHSPPLPRSSPRTTSSTDGRWGNMSRVYKNENEYPCCPIPPPLHLPSVCFL